ncbi:uncharacterized protein C8orf76 homolog isoform X2 [Bufo gargarizans]|uniref:uncharacterized protein C8orf76 homolog isoform X2 n=1 Tax=Bufo gargarizans TaxID=30331 RepID=UPI001CF15C0D|nr:uncharacterized protein C8orf76 homolog isoform X2 [Bufo gargarizans]
MRAPSERGNLFIELCFRTDGLHRWTRWCKDELGSGGTMECDFCFEDSVFSETRERTSQRGQSYRAKQCEPQWFNEDVTKEHLAEVHNIVKFRADLLYRQKDFEKAFIEYSDCYALIPPANNVMRRDVQESQARCLIRLGRHKEALEIAEDLLQATSHNHLGNRQEEVSCLQQLISLHPFNPHFWIRLAESYMSLFLTVAKCKDPSQRSSRFSLCSLRSLGTQQCIGDIARAIDSTASVDDGLVLGYCNEGDSSSLTVYTNGAQLWMWSCASYIRARLLLQFIQPQQASFVLENNLKTQEQIEKQLEKAGLLEEQKIFLMEAMGEDLLAERTKDEGQTDPKTTQPLTSYVMPSDAEFRVRWFHKMNTP